MAMRPLALLHAGCVGRVVGKALVEVRLWPLKRGSVYRDVDDLVVKAM
jgi:hypothetical protein